MLIIFDQLKGGWGMTEEEIERLEEITEKAIEENRELFDELSEL